MLLQIKLTHICIYDIIFQEHPAYHWPNVVMMISNQSTDGVITDKVNCFYDKVKMIE